MDFTDDKIINAEGRKGRIFRVSKKVKEDCHIQNTQKTLLCWGPSDKESERDILRQL